MWNDRESRIEVLTWVATVGTVLGAVLVALPLLPKSAFSLSAATSVFIGIVIVVAALALYRAVHRMRQEDTELLEATKAVTIVDTEGKQAHMLRQMTYLATRNITSWSFFMTMKADGNIEDIRINDQPVKTSDLEVILGTIHMKKVFMEPMKRGQRVTAKVTYTLLNSYVGPEQKSIMGVSQKPKKIRIEIQLPKGRPCTRARVHLSYNDRPAQALDGVVISDNRQGIVYECKNPKLGGQYQLIWDW